MTEGGKWFLTASQCPPWLPLQVHSHKAQGIYMVTARESSPLQCRQQSSFAWPPCKCTINCSLPLLGSAQVCGRHMALLPSFLASELATMWHVANPACICLVFCYPKHKNLAEILIYLIGPEYLPFYFVEFSLNKVRL